ncbi:UNVERIFIED_CONTAM: hypothetical protein Slati_1131900 [Sesamum latifolium]|uniref:Myb/SANT-like domain-containing protein n=1 Tax=Sesamum latifolium TaxID=2727402 RepID=A0AAW2XCL3_9LAMI
MTTTRRTWSQREEEVLINALRTIITIGWKCDNGFRSGYLNQLETIMCKHFPNTDLRAEPHINSKIHVWKKYYSSLMGMMSKSGFGWDDTRHMVIVENNDVWEDYVKPDSTINSTTATRKSGSTGKKRKVANSALDERLVDCILTFCETSNVRMVELSKRLSVDFDEVEKRSNIFDAVGNVEGIDMTEQLLLADILVENPKKMDLFFSLNESARGKMLRLMLEGKM